jgi:hypothetical protein
MYKNGMYTNPVKIFVSFSTLKINSQGCEIYKLSYFIQAVNSKKNGKYKKISSLWFISGKNLSLFFFTKETQGTQNIVPWWRYLLGYRPSHLVIRTPFIADYTVGITIVLLQTVLTLTVLIIALFVDSLVPRWFPCCLVFCFRTRRQADWLSRWLFCTLLALTNSPLCNSCLKVGTCGGYSKHLVSPFIYAVCEFGCWWNVYCAFHIA